MIDQEDLRGLQNEFDWDRECQEMEKAFKAPCEQCSEWFYLNDLEDGICPFCQENNETADQPYKKEM